MVRQYGPAVVQKHGHQDAYSILAHFPGLELLHTCWCWESSAVILLQDMRNQFARYCPLLRNVALETSATNTEALLMKVFQSMGAITIPGARISSDVISGIISHRQTLTAVTFSPTKEYYEREVTFKFSGDIPVPERTLLLIPQACNRLTTIMFPT
ncbi:MAG: hypothetical protein J3Q66DRAFT_363283 [Benniella sp.]|nr:MAG: hypothetical protein J3Q66DRAFT_363283 [Benniella sp.]